MNDPCRLARQPANPVEPALRAAEARGRSLTGDLVFCRSESIDDPAAVRLLLRGARRAARDAGVKPTIPLTTPSGCRSSALDGSRRSKAAGMKREHGEEEPSGAESVTAPATVSGERTRTAPLGIRLGRTGERVDPQVRRPAIATVVVSGGVSRREVEMPNTAHAVWRHDPVASPPFRRWRCRGHNRTGAILTTS